MCSEVNTTTNNTKNGPINNPPDITFINNKLKKIAILFMFILNVILFGKLISIIVISGDLAGNYKFENIISVSMAISVLIQIPLYVRLIFDNKKTYPNPCIVFFGFLFSIFTAVVKNVWIKYLCESGFAIKCDTTSFLLMQFYVYFAELIFLIFVFAKICEMILINLRCYSGYSSGGS